MNAIMFGEDNGMAEKHKLEDPESEEDGVRVQGMSALPKCDNVPLRRTLTSTPLYPHDSRKPQIFISIFFLLSVHLNTRKITFVPSRNFCKSFLLERIR